MTADDIRAIVREELERARVLGADVMTREQVAELLQVDPHTVTKYVKRRGLPGITIGGKWRFRRDAVLRWMEEQKA